MLLLWAACAECISAVLLHIYIYIQYAKHEGIKLGVVDVVGDVRAEGEKQRYPGYFIASLLGKYARAIRQTVHPKAQLQ